MLHHVYPHGIDCGVSLPGELFPVEVPERFPFAVVKAVPLAGNFHRPNYYVPVQRLQRLYGGSDEIAPVDKHGNMYH
jgi:hypothetical protein